MIGLDKSCTVKCNYLLHFRTCRSSTESISEPKVKKKERLSYSFTEVDHHHTFRGFCLEAARGALEFLA
jgi:hypothetical protein